MYREEYADAETLLQTLVSHRNPDIRSLGKVELCNIALHRGLFDEALDRLGAAIATSDEELGQDAKVIWYHEIRAKVFELLGDFDAAVVETRIARDLLRRFSPTAAHPTLHWKYTALEARILAQAGDDRRADSLLEVVKGSLDRTPGLSPKSYWFGRADVALHREEYDTALAYYSRIAGANPEWNDLVDLGRAYLGARRYRDAIQAFENALRRHDSYRWSAPATSVLLHYWLGLTYEKSGRLNDAATQYERFLHLWRNADPVITEIEDARERLAALRRT
jgi:tetratricopeptide (TPR) repeat protein